MTPDQMNRLQSALVAADKAGDTEAARALAGFIRQAMPVNGMQAQQQQAPMGPQDIPSPVYSKEMRPNRELSFMDRVQKGASDLVAGGAQLAAHVLPKNNVLDPAKIDKAIQEKEFIYQDKRGKDAGIDWGRALGNTIAGLPLATVGSGLAAAAATGAALGALQPVTEGDFATEKAKQAAFGGAASLAGGALLKAGSKLIHPGKEIAKLTKEGVKPTIGQIFGNTASAIEQRAMSIPLLGDVMANARRGTIAEFNRAALNRAVKPLGARLSGKIGREGLEEVSDVLSNAYQEVLPKLTFRADQKFATEVDEVIKMAREGLPEPQVKQLELALRNKLFARMSQQGVMDGQTLKGVESELSRVAKGYRGDASFDTRQVGDALDSVLTSVRGVLERSNPEHAARLKDINQGYAVYARLRDATGRIGANDGVFTPAQLMSAVRAGDKSVGKGQFAKGKAILQDLAEAGKNTLGSTVPNSGTPERLMTGMAALGGLGYVNPLAAGTAIASAAPYLPGARQALATLLARRPDVLSIPAQAVSSLSPVAGAAGPAVVQAAR